MPKIPAAIPRYTKRIASHRGTLRWLSQLTAGAIATAKKAAISTRPITVRIRYEKYRAASTAAATSTTFATALAEICVWSIAAHPRPATGRATIGTAEGYLPAAAQRDHAADGEADDGGADRELAAMLTDLAAPVRELGNTAPQCFDRVGQLASLPLDVRADLIRASSRRAGGPATDGLPRPADVDIRRLAHRVPASNVSLVRLASSMARSGVGGAPAFIER